MATIRTPNQFNLGIGEARKAAGINLVSGNGTIWMGNALRIVMLYAPDYPNEFLAEIFKTFPGIGQPHHVNAWGALTRRAKELRIIVGTDRFVKSHSPLNNAHPYELYTRVRPSP